MQDEQAEEYGDGGFEGHQGPERGGRHVAQREHLEGVRQDGEQEGQPGRGGEDAGGEVSGGLRDAGEQEGQGGPGERAAAVGARGGDGHRAEELDRDGGAERDAVDRGQERDGLQPGGDAQAGQRGYVVRA